MADTVPENLFEQLNRRTLTPADRSRLVAVKSALRLSESDELWPLIMTLDHYAATTTAARNTILKALAEMPAKVEVAVKASETAASRNASQAVARAVEQGVVRLSSIVAKRSETTADRISKRQFLTAATIGGLGAIACIGVGWTAAHFYFETQLNICTGEIFRVSGGGVGCYLR